ncbi:MAG: peptide chain release factor N(5)-glutamine methyltransferase [Alphaproteobacteria bacterium]
MADPGADRPTVAEAVAEVARRLAAAGVDDAVADARLLARHALRLDRSRLLADRDHRLSAAQWAELDRLAARRARREPVSRIVGVREFWSLDFALTAATLDPRPDSETVVDAALARVPDRSAPVTVLDLGTGSGCLLLALLSELPNGWGVGVDRSAAAAAMARRNASRLGLARRAAFVTGDWGAALDGAFDLVVANPPYVADAEFAGLAPEVARFDPPLALAGGADGLDAHRALADTVAGLVVPGGWALVEVGAGQADAVAALLDRAGLRDLASVADLAGIPRCVAGRK